MQKKDNKYPNKVWETAPDVWKTESAYWIYIRGQLRNIWRFFPPKNKFKAARAIPNFKGSGVTNPRVKNVVQCEYCKDWFPASATEIDHIQQVGRLKSYEDVPDFLYKLLAMPDNMQILCRDKCHKTKSYAERMGISMEDAFIEKECIAFSKLPPDKQLSILKAAGIDCSKLKNAAQRKDKYRTHLRGNRETID